MTPAKHMLDLAARLALRGAGRVEPNPLVGCVIVKDGRIIGMGHHREYGGLHAEREALADCARRAESPRGSTVYCTLEPCGGHGKQPPCVEALVAAGVSRVIFASLDESPNKGRGAMQLKAAGIGAELCRDSPLASGLCVPWAKRESTGLPWVVAKWAQTIDGRVATRSGESKWISNERSRARVHRLRARADAILTGIGTVRADDPLLTARGVRQVRRCAARIIADTDLDLPTDAKLVQTARETPTYVACDRDLLAAEITSEKRARLESAGVKLIGVPRSGQGQRLNMRELLRVLWSEFRFATVMIEAGPGLLGGMFDEDLIDEAVVYIAPLMLGDELAKSVAVGRLAESLGAARRYDLWRIKALSSDVELTYRRALHHTRTA